MKNSGIYKNSETEPSPRSRTAKVCEVVLIVLLLCVSVALLFSFSGGIIKGPPGAYTENTAYNLKNSISAYFTEYRKYPKPQPPQEATYYTDHRLMDILLASDSASGKDNPKRIMFYVDRQAKSMEDGRFQKGVDFNSNGGGSLWDQYGNKLKVRVDSNHDNRVEDPEHPGQYIPESILVWSAGPDGNFETWEDNIKTW